MRCARNEAGRTSPITTAEEASGSNAAGRASVSTTAKEAGTSSAAGRASASTTANDTMHRAGHLQAQTYMEELQGLPTEVGLVSSS